MLPSEGRTMNGDLEGMNLKVQKRKAALARGDFVEGSVSDVCAVSGVNGVDIMSLREMRHSH